jgi:hypothetical protein
MHFKLWLETSYQPSDIPKYFYLIGNITTYDGEKWVSNEIAEQLSKLSIDGITGISSQEIIIPQFMGVARDMILVMDGTSVIKENKLTRVMYDNPEYLASNNMAALKRIWNRDQNSPNSKIATNLMQYLAVGAKTLSSGYSSVFAKVHSQLEYDGGFKLSKTLPNNIKKITDLAIWLSAGFKDINLTITDARKIIVTTFQLIGKIYKDEGEWILKDKKLKIPKQSELYILVPQITKEVWERYLENKSDTFFSYPHEGHWKKRDCEQLYDILNSLTQYQLFSKYSILFLAATDFNKLNKESMNLQALKTIARKHPISS